MSKTNLGQQCSTSNNHITQGSVKSMLVVQVCSVLNHLFCTLFSSVMQPHSSLVYTSMPGFCCNHQSVIDIHFPLKATKHTPKYIKSRISPQATHRIQYSKTKCRSEDYVVHVLTFVLHTPSLSPLLPLKAIKGVSEGGGSGQKVLL